MGASKDFSEDEIEVLSYSNINNIFSGGGSISSWFFARTVTNSGEGECIGMKEDTSGFGFKAWLYGVVDVSGPKLSFEHMFDTASRWETSTNSISLDTWHNFTVVYNSSFSGNIPIFYLNGEEVSLTNMNTPSGSAKDDSGGAFISGISNNINTDFDGKISYIQLFDRELTQPEIKEIMYKPGSIRNGLVGFWPLTDDGSTQRNLSGIGNTGAVTGATNSNDGPPVTCFK